MKSCDEDEVSPREVRTGLREEPWGKLTFKSEQQKRRLKIRRKTNGKWSLTEVKGRRSFRKYKL